MNAHTAAAAPPAAARKWALTVVSLLLVVAFVAAAVGAVLWAKAAWWDDSTGATESEAAARVTFLRDAGQAALNLTTVTPDDADSMLDNIASSSTGDLAVDLQDPVLREQLAKDIQDRGVKQVSRVVAISPSSFDPEAGRGQALVFIVQDLTSAEGQSALRRQGMSLDMELVDGVWKVSTMEQLFEGIGAAPGGDTPGALDTSDPVDLGDQVEDGSSEDGLPAEEPPVAENPDGS